MNTKKASKNSQVIRPSNTTASALNVTVVRSKKPKPNNVNNELRTGVRSNDNSESTMNLSPQASTNSGADTIPVKWSQSKSKEQVLLNKGDRQEVHKSIYETGFRPTKSQLMLAKQYGVEVKTITDTKIDFRSANLRNTLTQGCGFNMKQIHLPCPRAQLPWYDVLLSTIPPVGDNHEIPQYKSSEVKTTASVLNLKQQFLIKNDSAAFPMVFTIHIVRLRRYPCGEENATMNRLLKNGFLSPSEYTVGEGEAVNPPNKIPRWFQEGGYVEEQSGDEFTQVLNISLSNKWKNLNHIPSFRNTFDLVDSISKTIDPGDYWNFSHIHNCGSGIDMELLTLYGETINGDQTTEGVSQILLPYTYGFIFEVKGKLCEAFVVDPSETELDTYIGTSPTFYSYEFKTTMNIVRDTVQGSDRPYLRVSRLRPATLQAGDVETGTEPREIRLSLDKMSQTPITSFEGLDGHFYIPYQSPTAISTQGFGDTSNPG